MTIIAEYVVGLLKAEDLMPVSRLIENGFPLAGMEINKEDLPEASAQLLDTCATLKVSHTYFLLTWYTPDYSCSVYYRLFVVGLNFPACNSQILELRA